MWRKKSKQLALSDNSNSMRVAARDTRERSIRQHFTNGTVYMAIDNLRNSYIRLPINPQILRDTRESVAVNSYRNYTTPYPHRKKTADMFSFLRQKLTTVDFERAMLSNLDTIILTLNERVPKHLSEMETELRLEGFADEAYYDEDLRELLEQAITAATKLPSRLSILHVDSVQGTAQEGPEALVSFPDISSYKDQENLSEELTALKQDWENAHELPLSVEDSFTIEQVVTSYLPEALSLFERFRRRTGDVGVNKAQGLLLEQVKLIRKQVSFVLEQHSDDSLNMMEAHMSFLKAKNEQLGL
jgi:hypothetical protein